MKKEGERKRERIKGLKRKGFRKPLDSIEVLFQLQSPTPRQRMFNSGLPKKKRMFNSVQYTIDFFEAFNAVEDAVFTV